MCDDTVDYDELSVGCRGRTECLQYLNTVRIRPVMQNLLKDEHRSVSHGLRGEKIMGCLCGFIDTNLSDSIGDAYG